MAARLEQTFAYGAAKARFVPRFTRCCAPPERLLCLFERLEVDTLVDCECVLQLEAEVADGAVHLRVAEEQLDRAQVASLLVDLRGLRPPYGVCAVGARLQ